MPGESPPITNEQERTRLLTALRESEILRELAELLASSLDLDAILKVLVKRTTEVCEVERCAVWLLEDAPGIFRPATYHLSSQHLDAKSIAAADALWYRTPLPFDDPVVHRLLKQNGLLALENLHDEASMRTVAETFLVRSVLLVALIREGRPVGMMSLDDPSKQRTFSAAQQQLARAIGHQAAIAIDNARLYAQAQAERRRSEQEKAHLLDEARRAAELANERANTLDAIFHAMTEGISVLNLDGQIVLRNNAAASFLGKDVYSRDRLDEVLQRHPAFTLHGQPITSEDFPLTRALRGEHIRGERFRVQRADGMERVVEMNVAPLFDSTQQQIGIVSAVRDITQQMRVEQRIRQALETMLHVAEAVSGITDIKAILHSVLAMTLTTLNCSPGTCLLYDQEQQTFTPLVWIGFSEGREEQWLAQQQVWLAPEAGQYEAFRTLLREGHVTLINAEQYPYQPNPFHSTMILAAPISHNNHLLGLMILDGSATFDNEAAQAEVKQHEFTLWDIAVVEGIAQLAGLAIEQARWQQEALSARTSEAAMREANALKDEFLAITAHEFRTPLTVILAHSQLALRTLHRMAEQEPSNHLSENLMIIEEQTRQLTNIVNTFLEVTQINRGQLSLKLEQVDLAEIVAQVVTQHSATSLDHQFCCRIEPSEQNYFVMGDSARLRQIIANLVQNAIKYSPQGGPIAIVLRRSEATIEVCVEDKGIGIPQDAQTRLFERFYRGSNIEGSKTRGIGLGLYVVAQLLQMHGGTIRVESSGVYGEGSRFIFTLPALERTVSV